MKLAYRIRHVFEELEAEVGRERVDWSLLEDVEKYAVDKVMGRT